jgi:hypothetical protein
VVPRGGIFLGKWRSSFAGNSDGKMNVQSACALNTRYILKPNVLRKKITMQISPIQHWTYSITKVFRAVTMLLFSIFLQNYLHFFKHLSL